MLKSRNSIFYLYPTYALIVGLDANGVGDVSGAGDVDGSGDDGVDASADADDGKLVLLELMLVVLSIRILWK